MGGECPSWLRTDSEAIFGRGAVPYIAQGYFGTIVRHHHACRRNPLDARNPQRFPAKWGTGSRKKNASKRRARKSGYRFSEKDHAKIKDKAGGRFEEKLSRFRASALIQHHA